MKNLNKSATINVDNFIVSKSVNLREFHTGNEGNEQSFDNIGLESTMVLLK